jgi:uncharacterized protein (TIRG00374 family)
LLKRVTSTVLKILISFLLIYLLFMQKDMNLKEIYDQIVGMNVIWILVGILFFTGSTILGAIQWKMLMQAREIFISTRQAISFYYVGLFFNNFLPGYVAGDAFRIYDITKSSGKNTDAVSTVLVDRLIGFAMLTTLALVASLIWMALTIFSSTMFFTLFTVFLGWMLALLILFNGKLARNFRKILAFVLPDSIVLKIREVYLSINSYKNHRKLLIDILFISFFIQSLRILTHFAAGRAMGIDSISIFYFFIFIPIVALAVTLPFSIGGFGIREQTAVNLFCLPGVGGVANQVISMEFIAYFIGVVCSLPGGIIFVLRKKHAKINLNQDSLVISSSNQ